MVYELFQLRCAGTGTFCKYIKVGWCFSCGQLPLQTHKVEVFMNNWNKNTKTELPKGSRGVRTIPIAMCRDGGPFCKCIKGGVVFFIRQLLLYKPIKWEVFINNFNSATNYSLI